MKWWPQTWNQTPESNDLSAFLRTRVAIHNACYVKADILTYVKIRPLSTFNPENLALHNSSARVIGDRSCGKTSGAKSWSAMVDDRHAVLLNCNYRFCLMIVHVRGQWVVKSPFLTVQRERQWTTQDNVNCYRCEMGLAALIGWNYVRVRRGTEKLKSSVMGIDKSRLLSTPFKN